MNTCMNNISIEDVGTSAVVDSMRYCAGFETDVPPEPVFIFYRSRGKYYPVAYQRLIPALKKDRRSVRALVGTDLQGLLRLFVNLRGIHTLNIIEKLLLLKHAGKTGTDSEIVRSLPQGLSKYDAILGLPSELLLLVASNRLSPDLCMKLLGTKKIDLLFFAALIHMFHLNHNQQRELLDFLKDRCRRSKRTFRTALDWNSFVNTKDARIAEKLLNHVRREQMPGYYRSLDEFDAARRELHLPNKVNLVEPPYFESKTVKLELFFKTREELADILKKLSHSTEADSRIWEKLFSKI